MHVLAVTTASLLQDESGQDLIEYALVAALVGLGAVASLNSLTNAVSNAFASLSNQLASAV